MTTSIGTSIRIDRIHLEFLVQGLDIVLDALDQLGLVFTDGTADVRPDEQRVVAGEDAEHLVGVFGGTQLVAESGCDARLHAVDALIVSARKRGSSVQFLSRKSDFFSFSLFFKNLRVSL